MSDKNVDIDQKEIKKCPFCGEAPTPSYILMTFGIKTVACENPYCEVKPCAIGHTWESALEKWNIRKGELNERNI